MVQSTTPIRGIPAIPEVTSDDAEMNLLLSALKESIEVLTGTRGDPNSRAITFGEATENGNADLFATNSIVDIAQGSQDSVRLTGDVTGTGLFDSAGAVVVPALLQLPNIIRIDGGAADTVYSSQIAGPYGIEGTPAGGTTGQVFGKLSDTDYDYGWITQVGFGAGGGVSILQIDQGESRAEFATAGTAIPFDNTTPQITEGDQIMSNIFVPEAVGNILTIEVCAFITCTTLSDWVTVSLFKDSDPDAIASASVFVDTALGGEMIQFVHYETTTGVSAATYTVRAGQDAGTALGFNAVISAGTQPRLNNNFASRLTITETDLAPSTGLGTDTAVQANGLTLTAAATLLNFVDFTVVESVADQITISGGNIVTEALFCPNYDYTFVDTTTWRIDGLDITKLFRIGRRLQFTAGATTSYGTIFSSAFTGGNTEIVMAMEDSAVLTASATEVCFTISATAWSPIAEDPFVGTAIRGIATGVISSVQYWVICGDSGKLAYSTDKGISWTTVSTGTTEHLLDVKYAADVEEFLCGGMAGVLLDSSDGTTWNLDTTSIPAIATTGNSDIHGVTRNRNDGEWFITTNLTTVSRGHCRDQGTLTWVINTATRANTLVTTALELWDNDTSSVMYGNIQIDDSGFLSDTVDTTFATLSSNYFTPTNVQNTTKYRYFRQGAADRHLYCGEDGQISNYSSSVVTNRDDVTFIEAHRGIAYSPTLDRYVVVGDLAQIGYYDGGSGADTGDDDAWVSITSGLAPSANFTDVEWNDTDVVYIAVGDNGQILRSSNGLGDALLNPQYSGFGLEAADPFSGGAINRIIAGAIGSTIWWVAIGTGGAIYTSNDKGISWTARTSGTSNSLLSIGYNATNEQFVIGGAGGILLDSDDGITWNDNPGFVAGGGGSGSNDVVQVLWDENEALWWIIYVDLTANRSMTFTNVIGTRTDRDTNIDMSSSNMISRYDNTFLNLLLHSDAEDLFYAAGASDSTTQVFASRTPANGLCVACFAKLGTGGNVVDVLIGIADGTIEHWENVFLRREFQATGAKINAFAHSTTSSRYVAVCDGGVIYTHDEADFNGAPGKWYEVSNNFVGNINDCWYDASDDVFIAVSSQGEIGRSTTGIDDAPGTATFGGWTLDTNDPMAGTPVNRMAVGVVDGVNYWVVIGNSGRIFTSDDEGVTWVQQASGQVAANLLSIGYSSSQERFLIGGASGQVMYSAVDDITTWTEPSLAGLEGDVTEIAYFTAGNGWNLNEDFLSGSKFSMNPTTEVLTENGSGIFTENRWVYSTAGSLNRIYCGHGVAWEYFNTLGDNSPATLVGNIGMVFQCVAVIQRVSTYSTLIGGPSGRLASYEATTQQAVHDAAATGGMVEIAYSSVNNRFVAVTDAGEIVYLGDDATSWTTNDSERLVVHTFDGSAFTDIVWDAVAGKFIAVNATGQIGWSDNGVS